MWQPNEEQAQRIERVVATVDRLADELNFAALGKHHSSSTDSHFSYWEEILLLLPTLPTALGPDAERGLSEYLCFPAARPVPLSNEGQRRVRRAAELAATDWLIHTQSAYAADLLLARLRVMLSHPAAGNERPVDDRLYLEVHRTVRPDESYLFPRIWDILTLLAELPASEDLLAFLEEVFAGKWPLALSKVVSRETGRIDWHWNTDVPWDALAMHLQANGRLSETDYNRAMAVVGPMLMDVAAYSGNAKEEHELGRVHHAQIEEALQVGHFPGNVLLGGMPPFMRVQWGRSYANHHPEVVDMLKDWAFQALQHRFDAMDVRDKPTYRLGSRSRYVDSRWLLLALRQLERLALDRKTFTKELREYRLVQKMAELLSVRRYGPGQSEETLLAELVAFKPETLERALPYAGNAKPGFLRALGWHDTLPLYALLREHAWEPELHGTGQEDSDGGGTPHMDRPAMLAALRQVKPEHRKRFAEAMAVKPAGVIDSAPENQPLRPYLMAVEALEGSNRIEIDKAMAKGAFFAIRAYGLLPVPDDAELRLRYLRLRQLLTDAAEFGAERRVNTQNTVAIAMDYLAESAGYADGMRLEWAMEAQFAEEMRALAAPQEVEQWTLALDLDADSPQITVHKNGKPLASVPPALRKTAAYLALKNHLDGHRAQMRRFRKALEKCMAEGTCLSVEQLQSLRKLPYGHALLRTLVLCNEGDVLGLLQTGQDQLADLAGQVHPLGATFRIAHVHDLFQAGQLSQWQSRVVAQQWVQPFKQVFRELYILTPAEIESGNQSNRFANHTVRGQTASRLLQARNWQTARDDFGLCWKMDRSSGLIACWQFNEVYQYMGEADGYPVSGALFFAKAPLRNGLPGARVALTLVPALLLSETFRDADLTVSVAQTAFSNDLPLHPAGDGSDAAIGTSNDEARYGSEEMIAHRATVIMALVQALGLKTVRCEGRFAYIEGRRAQYRIHLVSAAIHILPGNYLCIVADKSGSHTGKLYLPFAETDGKITEILSKILLLVRDDRINDRSITQQIDAALAAGTLRSAQT